LLIFSLYYQRAASRLSDTHSRHCRRDDAKGYAALFISAMLSCFHAMHDTPFAAALPAAVDLPPPCRMPPMMPAMPPDSHEAATLMFTRLAGCL